MENKCCCCCCCRCCFCCCYFYFSAQHHHFQCWTNFSLPTYQFATSSNIYINAFGCYNLFHGFWKSLFFRSFFSRTHLLFSLLFHSCLIPKGKWCQHFLEVLLKVVLLMLVLLLVPMFTNTSVKHFELQERESVRMLYVYIWKMDSHRTVVKEKKSFHFTSHFAAIPFPFFSPVLTFCISHDRFLLHQPTANSC